MENRRGLSGLGEQRWVVQPPAQLSALPDLPDLHPIVAHIVANRHIPPTAVEAFLRARSATLYSPFLLAEMPAAVARIRAAIERRERILVYGDFDVDGVTACALVVRVLTELGALCQPYIPHRTQDGYGLNKAALQTAANDGTRLVVTVDCGISSFDEVAFATSLGMDVIVTDHHIPPLPLPQCVAVINPHHPLSQYPYRHLAGVGVAYKLAQALVEGTAQRAVLYRVIDLVAIGSIADMVPLQDENRHLVRAGLRHMHTDLRVGLRALAYTSKLRRSPLTAFDVSYRIAPRLNSAGRLDNASLSYRLLMTDDTAEAEHLAHLLESTNHERQRLTLSVLETARAQAMLQPNATIHILLGDAWPSGVIGLVAGRLAEETGRPVFLIESGHTICRGSARGQGRLNVHAALEACHDLLIAHGGHPQAAGFTLTQENVPAFCRRLMLLADDLMLATPTLPTLEIDADIRFSDITLDLCDALTEIEPCGVGNPAPLLLCRNVKIQEARIVGDSHLRLMLGPQRQPVPAVFWKQAHLLAHLPAHASIDVVFHLDVNEWDGRRIPQLVVRDLVLRSPND